ncbi:hypothetical protein A5893_07090 [Pedobacter psychrophilus]|uniref:DUF4177 domain-containing protein n=1 Tax=Pedobacter psychrophilus TaxID=1826909 RepID=A0A179DJJ9_9SPHI|nr:hypothetical protein [Pedobacter psychrophilus]OAQ40699.1 hypothetical protein A5893_07090 [Pedobacter psychrophilus]
MKKSILAIAIAMALNVVTLAQTAPEKVSEWKIVTVVESIVPMGVGRSRMIENTTEVNTDQFRTNRTDGKKSDQRSVSRSELKIEKFDEAKLLNFFSAVGINFQNIASNDAMIGARIMELEGLGYKLIYVTSGVESHAGGDDPGGIFITRMFFKK